MTAASGRDRYAQCHGDCTVDCGACKGKGRPVVPSEPPAETQQDDELVAIGGAILVALLASKQPPNSGALCVELARAALAASKPGRTCCDTRMGDRHQPGCPAIAEALGLTEGTQPERLTATTCPRWHRDADGWCLDERPHLAARPSADTDETAQQVLAVHQRRDIKGCSCGTWGSDHGHMGQSHGLHVLDQLRAAGLELVRR